MFAEMQAVRLHVLAMFGRKSYSLGCFEMNGKNSREAVVTQKGQNTFS